MEIVGASYNGIVTDNSYINPDVSTIIFIYNKFIKWYKTGSYKGDRDGIRRVKV